LAERAAVNRKVVGSTPTGGVFFFLFFFFFFSVFNVPETLIQIRRREKWKKYSTEEFFDFNVLAFPTFQQRKEERGKTFKQEETLNKIKILFSLPSFSFSPFLFSLLFSLKRFWTWGPEFVMQLVSLQAQEQAFPHSWECSTNQSRVPSASLFLSVGVLEGLRDEGCSRPFHTALFSYPSIDSAKAKEVVSTMVTSLL
jgi:hypothetical protein